jgi:iron(III) transport system substrate-binding protein
MGLPRLQDKNRLLVFGLACVLLVGVLAATAGASRKAPAAKTPPAVNVQQNLATLYAAAKQEGKVVWQVATTPAGYAPLVQAFQAKYPGIAVQLINVSGPELAGRLITESQAGKLSWDLSTGRPDTTQPVIARGLMAAPRWTLYGVPQSKLSLGGRLIHTYDFVVAPVYNTKMYKPSQLPKTWSDLLKPQWANGKFIVDGQPTEGWESLLLGKNPMTLKNYANFVVNVAKQNPLVLSTSANVLNGVAAGQAGLGLAAISNVPLLIQQGAPLAIDPISPVLALPSGVFVPTGAAHPAAARLLGAFLGSQAAEPLWATGGWTPAASPQLGGIAKLLADSGVKNFAYIDTKDELARVLAGFAIDQQHLHLQ